jgi:dTDP-glucose 4,6-dehydratase
MRRILITGGAGFIGHHLIEYLLEKTNADIACLDRLDVSGTLNRLTDLPQWEQHKKRVNFVWHDLKAPINEFAARAIGNVDYILHLAASTHVDRSLEDPVGFVMDNVVGTAHCLQFARSLPSLKLFINFATDEVFGPAPKGYAHKETDPHKPSNPYAASKSGGVALGQAFFTTYGLPVMTTYTMNNFGERQHPEKLIPKTIRSVLEQTPMPIFATLKKGKMIAIGSRYWLHCRNTASAILFLMRKGVAGESYNIIGFDEQSNLAMAQKIAAIIGKSLIPKLVDFHSTRPGHDIRYALDGIKLKKMGWKPEIDFDTSLERTVRFTIDHPQWR